jgi:hypothetical protein
MDQNRSQENLKSLISKAKALLEIAKEILSKIKGKISSVADKISSSSLGRKFEISPLFAQRGIFVAGGCLTVFVIAASMRGDSYTCDSGNVREDVFGEAREKYTGSPFDQNDLVGVAIKTKWIPMAQKVIINNRVKIDQVMTGADFLVLTGNLPPGLVPEVDKLQNEKLKVLNKAKYSLSEIRTVSLDEKLKKSTCLARLSFESDWGGANVEVSYRAEMSSDGVLVFLGK